MTLPKSKPDDRVGVESLAERVARLAQPLGSAQLPAQLPEGFACPPSFAKYWEANPGFAIEFEPWHFEVGDEGFNRWCSERYGRSVVMFAKADLEDTIACFVVDTSDDPKVVVLNPWAQVVVEGKTEEVCRVQEELPNFDAWLQWVRDSELVRTNAQVRAEREGH